MKRAVILLCLYSLSLLFHSPAVQGQGCSNIILCSIPVAGWGLYSLEFVPQEQIVGGVELYSLEYDTWTDFTLQAWIFLTPQILPLATERPIFFKGPFVEGNNGLPTSAELYLFVNGSDYLTFRMGGGDNAGDYGFNISVGPLTANQWTQVTVSVSAVNAQASIFVDGSLVASQNWLLTNPTAPYLNPEEIPRVLGGRIQIGLFVPLFSNSSETYRFMGRIDDVRIWNRTLEEGEVVNTVFNPPAGSADGLVAYFPFNEGSGSVLTSPWPLSTGRIAPYWVPELTATITPQSSVFWSSSEVPLNHPLTFYGHPGAPAAPPFLSASFFLYAVVPSGTTEIANLNFIISQFPAHGTLSWNNSEISLSDPVVTGTITDLYPLITYTPQFGYNGPDVFTYYASSRDGQSELIEVNLALGCRWIDQCSVCEGNGNCSQSHCDPIYRDACGVCFGNGSTCEGCNGVLGSNLKADDCGVCNGNNSEKDACGVCFGNDNSCIGCDGILEPNPERRRIIDACGVCTLPCNANLTCMGCDGIVKVPPMMLDACGVCGGNGSTCLSGCNNMPNSKEVFDVCGVCGGDGYSCAGCNGVPEPDPAKRAKFDVCGVCGGNGSTCADCNGIPLGPNPPDVCGVCNGNGTSCLDCAGIPFGKYHLDECGVCGGDNSTCEGCNGVPEPDPLLRAKFDVCGVCGGNGTSCSGEWCDPTVPLSQLDACGVCNGDNSTCMCVTYRNRSLGTLDCTLLQWTLTITLRQ